MGKVSISLYSYILFVVRPHRLRTPGAQGRRTHQGGSWTVPGFPFESVCGWMEAPGPGSTDSNCRSRRRCPDPAHPAAPGGVYETFKLFQYFVGSLFLVVRPEYW